LTTLLLEVFWQAAEIYLVGRINVYWLLEDKVFFAEKHGTTTSGKYVVS
jgi:hypothetical protein